MLRSLHTQSGWRGLSIKTAIHYASRGVPYHLDMQPALKPLGALPNPVSRRMVLESMVLVDCTPPDAPAAALTVTMIGTHFGHHRLLLGTCWSNVVSPVRLQPCVRKRAV
ncbi:hypothetical protein LIA77_07007 [Sarocladium implicatum]|nr:hypothetical protein LIA77_07007 [Sarocladium implicatum]